MSETIREPAYAPIRKRIEVPCDQQMAFEVFVSDMHTWWPLDRFSVAAKYRRRARELRVEPKEGGRIIEVDEDDSEHLWGTFITYQPFDFVKMHLHIAEPASTPSHVEVRFTVLGPARTQVDLVQSNWEVFGRKAPWMREGYDTGWVVIFEQQYHQMCQRRAGLSIPTTQNGES